MVLVTRGNNMRLLRGGRVQALIMPGKPREFTPDQLFLAMQGAWLEPKLGSMWQENTGVTPTTTGGQTIGKIADQSGYGNNATQPTAANRPTYQLNSNNMPLARHDTTDSLVVSLPSINVRRNLLTWSEQFDNAVWTKVQASVVPGSTLSPIGTSATKLVSNTVNAIHSLQQAAGTGVYTFSFYAKAAEYTCAVIFNSPNFFVFFDLTNGNISSLGAGWGSASCIPVDNGWYRCSATNSVLQNWGHCDIALRNTFSSDGNGSSAFAGDGTSGIYIWGAQLELGSVATDYQKITDWTSEAFASSGSVYFATPVGMSALHNQSMGTTYQLPAPSTDIYSWIVVPQRLSVEDESNLAIYMASKAGI